MNENHSYSMPREYQCGLQNETFSPPLRLFAAGAVRRGAIAAGGNGGGFSRLLTLSGGCRLRLGGLGGGRRRC